MKKMILFLLIFTHIGVYAQEQTEAQKIEQIEQTEKAKAADKAEKAAAKEVEKAEKAAEKTKKDAEKAEKAAANKAEKAEKVAAKKAEKAAEKAEKEAREADTTIRYNPHSLGMSFRFGGLANNRMGGISEHVGVYTTVFEFYTRARKGKSQYTPLVGLRISSPLGGVNPYTYGGLRWGFLFGGSQYVFDMRSKETGLGWSMLVNGGLTAELSSFKELIQISRNPIIIGGELEFKAIYNVHKYTGITFGLHMGYVASLDASEVLVDMLNQIPSEGEFHVDHGFTWAFSIGMIF